MNSNSHSNTYRQRIDKSGSPISVVKISCDEAYSDIYSLLQSYINNDDSLAWDKLKSKIDYLYSI